MFSKIGTNMMHGRGMDARAIPSAPLSGEHKDLWGTLFVNRLRDPAIFT